MGVLTSLALGLMLAGAVNASLAFTVVGDGVPQPLTAVAGDATRGRAIVVDRSVGLCLLCHSGPFDRTPEERAQGNLAGSLAGVASRYSAAQLRLRVADAKRLNPASLMPAFYRSQGMQRVGSAWQGQPVLQAQQVEDVVAFLLTLQ